MRLVSVIAVLLALAVPALAQDNVPRDPIQAEQERRIQGYGFEQSVRQNPQLYPYQSATQPVPGWTPQYGYAGPPITAEPQLQGPRPLRAPIPPQTHVRPHTQLTPPAISPRLPPEELPQHE
jgi:hypothetical protein